MKKIVIFSVLFVSLCSFFLQRHFAFAGDDPATALRKRIQAAEEKDRQVKNELEEARKKSQQFDRGKLQEAEKELNEAKKARVEQIDATKGQQSVQDADKREKSLNRTLQFYSGTASEAFANKQSLFSIDGLKTQLLPKVAKWITGLLSALAVIFLMYAGIQYLTAGGEEEKITNATKTTFYVLIGVILMMFAYAIVYLFLTILA